MAIEIRIESSWQTDDGEGRSVEVSTSERAHPGEDPSEDSKWFAGGDLGELKRYLTELLDRKAECFLGRDRRECAHCSRVIRTDSTDARFVCQNCTPSSPSPTAS